MLPDQTVVFYSTIFAGEYDLLCVEEGDTVVDAGASFGDFTMLASRKTGPKGKVIAIEPEPTNVSLLRRNIAINRLSNVIVIQAALSDSAGTARLMRQGPQSQLVDERYRLDDYLKVETVSLDQLKTSLGFSRFDIIKMDIEGNEVKALHDQICLREVEQLAVEAHGESNRGKVTEILISEGFKVSSLQPRHMMENAVRNCVLHIPSFLMAEVRTKGYALRAGRDFLINHGRQIATRSEVNSRIIYASRTS
jgi:FkbM family methyltransferase